MTSIVAPDVLAGAPSLAAGEIFELDLTAPPKFGANRQGGCNEINRIVDPVLGDCLELATSDSDQTLPGTNSPPLGGCYAVHRSGRGVAACLIAPVALTTGRPWFIRYRVAIPKLQPGLPGGWPGMKGRWFSLHEAYGPPFAGAGVTNLSLALDANGKDSFVYGPAGQSHSFWTPLVLDEWMDFVIAMTPSKTAGQASVTCNGVPLKSKGGNTVEHYPTLTAADDAGNLICYAQNYRSNDFGGRVRLLVSDFRIGSTLASVTGGSSTPPPPPPPPTPPVTPPASGISITSLQGQALKRYITAHGNPPGTDQPAIRAILAELG